MADSTKVEPAKSQYHATIEEINNEDNIRMSSKEKLNRLSPFIMESDGDSGDEILITHDKEKQQSSPKLDKTIPETAGNKYESPKVPHLRSNPNPSMHSDNLKIDELTPRQEVLLAMMDAHLNQMKDEEADLPDLRKKWVESALDILTGAPPRLPSLKEINHKIPIKDKSMRYVHHLLRCPNALKGQLLEKIQYYKNAGWWEEANVPQAAPMLCIPKKNGKLRTVIDCRKRNENTEKGVTPFPDQEQIHMDVARAKYRSKIDMSDAYEQIHVEPNDVWKTAFSIVYSTFLSHTMQQGDCNAPATFQRLMTVIFREYIGRFVHVYLDDIFVFSDTIAEHKEHLKLVFDKLRKAQLFLVEEKLDLFSKKMDCLGHLIDDRGIHTDMDKIACKDSLD